MTTSLPETPETSETPETTAEKDAGTDTAVAAPPKQSESMLGQLRHRPEAGALIGTITVFV
ncbi:hypothetical protein ACIQTC_17025, partial [Streptomyces sp. NPDC091217]